VSSSFFLISFAFLFLFLNFDVSPLDPFSSPFFEVRSPKEKLFHFGNFLLCIHRVRGSPSFPNFPTAFYLSLSVFEIERKEDAPFLVPRGDEYPWYEFRPR